MAPGGRYRAYPPRSGSDDWIVFGGSWGATLALIYAQAHPDKVRHLVLRGVFTMTRSSSTGSTAAAPGGSGPKAGRFQRPIPEDERDDMIAAYHRRLFSGRPGRGGALGKAWAAWENALATVHPTAPVATARRTMRAPSPGWRITISSIPGFSSATARSSTTSDRIAHIPGTIVQGAMT